jgi:hypothetical protein
MSPTTATKFSLTELDFDGIKQNIQNYLSGQSTFTDYNFEGSGLTAILNILSYNTSYLSFYLNMIANEMFLDSADRRENIVSLAKAIGYTPYSRKSAQAVINIVITPPSSPTPPSILNIPINTIFNTSVSGVNYTFVTLQSINVSYNSVSNQYVANNVPINEGILYTYQYTVNTTSPVDYIIPNSNVDTSSLNISVQTNLQNASIIVFNQATDLTLLNGNSNIYFLQETINKQYQVYFGDNILGVALSNGNVIYLNYLVCNGTAPNLANIFTPASNIGGYSNILVTTVSVAAGGAERESKESIRFTAPKNYQTQNRAVTAIDYQNILLDQYPNISSLSVWGGEDNIPPVYGSVFISLAPTVGSVITETTKQSIVKNILSPRNILCITPTIVDPVYTNIIINSTVFYNAQNTLNTQGQIKSLVLNTINNFATTYIGVFAASFLYSMLTRLIDTCETSITNDLTTIQIYQQFTPVLNVASNYNLNFSNAIIPGSLSSSSFVDLTDPNYTTGQLYNLDDDGVGNLREYKLVGLNFVYVNSKIGTVNYVTGNIVINNFQPNSVTNSNGTININVNPLVNDVIPTQNNILIINPADVSVNLIQN